MGKITGISWAHHTRNLWIGCEKVSPACKNCYAERDDARLFGGGHWGPNSSRKILSMVRFRQDLNKWDRDAKRAGEMRRVFINSLSDTFEDHADLVNPRKNLFDFLLSTSNLNHLLLTKRPDNIPSMVPAEWLDTWPSHVWVGITAENQKEFAWRWDALSAVPGISVRFASSEPLLGSLDLSACATYPDWMIVGGESAPKSKCRSIDARWVADLEAKCASLGVAFFFKQWGNARIGMDGTETYIEDKYAVGDAFPAYRRELPKQSIGM